MIITDSAVAGKVNNYSYFFFLGDGYMSNNVLEITEEDYIFAESKGISRILLYSRVWKGMTIWRARSLKVGNRLGEGLWTNWKDKSEVSKTTFYNNLKKGMSPEEAVKRQRVIGPKSRREG